MKRINTEPVDDVLRLFLRESGLETPLLQNRLLRVWPEVVGETIASQTEALRITHQTLWVRVHAPALRSQLAMMRSSLVQQLNAAVQAQVIYDLRFV
ncbi:MULTISPECIES: DciA family protein [Bacteroidales]|uniref:DciA family protein n=1 Tax=Bacteroidales TaxID=171549 RepID=UPI00359F4360